MLAARNGGAWTIAMHRLAEVSIGIAVALLFAIIWLKQKKVA
jgi:uncharacterized membrane protein YgaE (UPF0421/DUF939 family)